jgi:predicted dehydrogenase
MLEIYGSRGSIIAEGTIGQNAAGKMTAYLADAKAGYDAGQRRTESGGIEIAPPAVNMYRAEIEEFSRALAEKREPALSARLGVRSQLILSACYKSARSGKRVELG